MKVITFSKRIVINREKDKHLIVCNPGVRYLIDDHLFLDAFKAIEHRIHRVSDGPFLGHGNEYPGSRILFSRLRGMGDELGMTAVVRFYADLGRECHVLAASAKEPVWRNNPDVTSLVSEPLPLDCVWNTSDTPFFEKMFHMESLIEHNNEPDQENYYDMMYRFCGWDPKLIDSRYKRPYLYFSDSDKELEEKFMDHLEKHLEVYKFNNFIFYQYNASNDTRTIPEDKNIEILKTLDASGYLVYVFGDRIPHHVSDLFRGSRNIHFIGTVPDIRLYFSMIRRSRLVIGPDSSAIHVAGALSKPAIGFWGPFSPECRVKYYENHHAIWDKKICKHAPCFPPTKDLPFDRCPKGKNQKYCEVFSPLSGEEVSGEVSNILG
jgi:hypothetical protein